MFKPLVFHIFHVLLKPQAFPILLQRTPLSHILTPGKLFALIKAIFLIAQHVAFRVWKCKIKSTVVTQPLMAKKKKILWVLNSRNKILQSSKVALS